MKRFLLAALAAAFVVAPTAPARAQRRPPKIFNDKGACPFECCQYRRWKAEKTTAAYARPDRRSRRVGRFVAGRNVQALTGEVRTVPARYVVRNARKGYRPGDVLWVYTYLGEGFFKVWFRGRMREEDLEIGTPSDTYYPACKENPKCFGEMHGGWRAIWWVKIKSPAGWVGWTDKPENFSGAGGCG